MWVVVSAGQARGQAPTPVRLRLLINGTAMQAAYTRKSALETPTETSFVEVGTLKGGDANNEIW